MGLSCDIFRQVFCSAAIGVEKPNERFFQYVLAARPDRQEVWGIGDRRVRADIASTNAVGLPAILVGSSHPSANQGVRGLAEIRGVLGTPLASIKCVFYAFSRLCYTASRNEWEDTVMDIIRVTASEFQKAFGALSDKALREPVAITKQGRDHLVVLSAVEYARLKRRDRTVYAAGDLPDEWLEAAERSAMDPRHDHLNTELKDWKP
jgi:PHD/YefM family antitoxin component YafN of YafNO toxin-antitoxin module